MSKFWYVVHTYSGHENKVKTYLENVIGSSKFKDKFGEVIVPVEDVIEMKDGRKTVSKRKFLPSYVLVEMEMTKETWHLVMMAPGVTSFVGTGKKPQPLQEDEVKHVLGQIEGAKAHKGTSVPFIVGDTVKVVDGPFSDFTGFVDEVEPERGKVKVMVSIFGRPTPVELDVLQVEKIEAKE